MRAVDLVRLAVSRVGLADPDAIPDRLYAFAFDALNDEYRRVWDAFPFRDQRLCSVAVSTAAAELVLPPEIDAVRAMRTTGFRLSPTDVVVLSDWVPGSTLETGTPYAWYPLADVAVTAQPSAAAVVTVTSASADDEGVTIRIHGEDEDGIECYEDIVLAKPEGWESGDPVTADGTTTFSEILQITKAVTEAAVVIAVSAVELARIPAWENESRYRRLRLQPAPDSTVSLLIEATRRFPRLVSDNDTILLAKAEPVVLDRLTAALYDFNEQPDRAAALRQSALDAMQVAIRHESSIEETLQASYPAFSMYEPYGQPVANPTSPTY